MKILYYEELGRKIWLQKLKKRCNNIYFTKIQENVDCRWTKNGKEYVGEIKYRTFPLLSNTIQKKGILLQEDKYNKLKEYELEGITPYYINIMNDNYIVLFNISKLKELEFNLELLPDKDGEKKEKSVTYLPVSAGKVIKKF